MQLPSHPAPICAHFSFSFLKNVIQRSKMACHSFVCHEHQSSLWRNHSINLFVNLCWTFTFCIEKLYDRTQPVCGWTLDQHCHFKHVSQVKEQGQWQCCHSEHKKFPYRPTHDVSLLYGHASCSVYFFVHINQQKQCVYGKIPVVNVIKPPLF
jgi:hypothetical protein